MSSPIEKMAEAFQDELRKIKIARMKKTAKGGILLPMMAGAAGWEWLRRANRDRKIGQSVRQQQPSY